MLNLKIARIKKGYSQQEFSELLGIHRSYYSMIETGARNPGFKLAKKIADILEVTVDEIFFEDTNNEVLSDSEIH